ncbi:MAG: MFS transporter, partial [Bryobacterales bacterium]|nr:MFS transporter [Bryobacterales bacterium]
YMSVRPCLALSLSAYAGMFVFGIVMALVGAILPPLAGRLAFDLADIGSMFLVMNCAMLVTSLLLGPAMDGFGMKPPMALGPLAVSAALLLIVNAGRFPQLLPAAALLGIGGGAVNGAANTLVADLHDDPKAKSAALNLLGVFFGIGALFLPFLIGALLTAAGVDGLLVATSLVCAMAGFLALLLRFPAPKQQQGIPFAGAACFTRSPLVQIAALLLFFQSGVEFILGGFISAYLTREFSVSVSTASWALAGYWAAVISSRIILSRALLSTSPYRVLAASAAAACVAAVLASIAPSPLWAVMAIVAVGFALGGIYPTVLGIMGSAFRDHSGTVFGILFTVALSGGILLPWATGQAAQALGLRVVFAIVAAAFAAVLLLARLLTSRARRHGMPPTPPLQTDEIHRASHPTASSPSTAHRPR